MTKCIVEKCLHPAAYQTAGDSVEDYCACHYPDDVYPDTECKVWELGGLIWAANHRDEKSLSGAGATRIAEALVREGYVNISQERPSSPWEGAEPTFSETRRAAIRVLVWMMDQPRLTSGGNTAIALSGFVRSAARAWGIDLAKEVELHAERKARQR